MNEVDIIQAIAGDDKEARPGFRLIDWLAVALEQTSILNKEALEADGCACYQFDGHEACFSPWAIGALPEDVVAKVKDVKREPMPEAMIRLMEASKTCPADSLDSWAECATKEK